MAEIKKIKSALLSVYDKDNLGPMVKKLNDLHIRFYSTGGTQNFIEKMGISVTSVEEITSYPPILGGRVKTLHPKIFGGILARRESSSDGNQMKQYDIPEIDLVIVDLYPFEETLASTNDHQAIIEKIDIGGISLIRAAAKNYNDVVVVASRKSYGKIIELLEAGNGETSLEDRKLLAAEAFNVTSHYDTAIFNYFNREQSVPSFKQSITTGKTLRYGENPHQKGSFFGELEKILEQLWGKEISYNNLLDVDAAIHLMADFKETSFAILKHNNACGIASRPSPADAWKAALAADPVSAFGGIIITNVKVDHATAGEINKLFFEIIIAPAYDLDALDVLKQKKNRIILVQKKIDLPELQFRSLLNGVVVQNKDLKTESAADMKTVTKREPSKTELEDMTFANKVVKHTKSNAIVLVKNHQLLASGVGQMSRVDALKQAIDKALSFGFDLKGAVMASDAFFPFHDCVEIASKAGITAIIQPGGSVKDNESIAYCDNNNISMVMTGFRHFKH